MDQETAYSTRRTFARLLRFSKSETLRYILLFIIILCGTLVNLGYLEAIRNIVAGATSKSLHLVYYGTALAGITIILQTVINITQTQVTVKIKNASITNMQKHVLGQLHRKKVEDVENYHSSDIAGRLLNGVTDAQTGVNDKLLAFITNLLQIMMAMAYFSWLSLPLTLGLVGFTLAYPAITYPISRVLRVQYDKRGKEVADRDSILQEAIQGAEEVRTYKLQQHFQGVLKGRLLQVLARSLRISILERSFDALNRMATFGGMIFTLGFGGYQVLKGELMVGALATFIVTSGQLTNPLLSISRLWTDMIQAISQAQRVFSLLDLRNEEDDLNKNSNLVFHPGRHDITLKQVNYAYNNGRKSIYDISFSIKSGQMAAIVGPSGSGKSTILKLLLRLYTPEKGEILYNDVSIHEIPLAEWRSRIGYVSQQAIVFSGSIKENICFGLENVPMDEVVKAAKLAHIHHYISALPQGYDTAIGERGVQLSGGEVQRLSLARVYLRNPQILLLDEPTSALDVENERKFRQSLQALAKDRTTIVIAHKLDTIQHADTIIVVEGGRVTEVGTHADLVRKQGEYFSFLQEENMKRESNIS
ncbi:ABC transporter ATP-binding protein [Paenibacillus sp. GCM10012306]|uniref:ABC transporter ATP-binding protein n=1 Tax=Paenibacillus sp. GCM10012306 TaxID=3317342 RepID=UPI003612BAD5